MADELKVVVSADASRLNTEMAKATNSLQKFKAGSAQAQQSLMNLGLVVQDAPFGFIGIANNIDPLIESFTRLKNESGGVGGALKSLASSLIGPQGIALAFSAVVSAITFYTMSSRGAADETEKVNKKIDEAVEAQKKYDESIRSATNSTFSQKEQLIDLKKTLTDTSNAYNNLSASVLRNAFANLLANQKEGLLKQILEKQLKIAEEEFKKKNPFNSVREFNPDFFSKDKTKKDLAELNADLVNLNKKIKALGLEDIIGNILFPTKGIEKAKKALKELQYEVFRVKPLPTVSDNELINFQKQVEKGVNSLPDKITVPANIQLVGSKQFNDDINAKVFKPLQNFNAELLAAVQGTINVLVDGISQAFSGDVAGGINSIFKGLLNVVGDFLIQLGLAAIGIGKLYAAINAGSFNPGLTITAGIAALVLGSVIKAFIPKFATGTRFAPGGTALVGERGPELVSLPEGARVTPAAQTGAILGGAMQSIQVYGVMRGRDIYFTNQRYGNSFNVGT